MAGAKIGFDHLRMPLDLSGATFSNDPSAIEYRHYVAEIAHDLHVVFDQKNGNAALTNSPNDLQQLDHIRMGQARGRFVQYQ